MAARPALLALFTALLATGVLVGVGTALAGEAPKAPKDTFSTTPLADYDTSTVVVARASFCDAVDPRQVEAALGAAPATERSWVNGDRIELPSGGRDVVHEYGCEYVAEDGSTARAWVFAPPVDQQRAKRLVKQPQGNRWCARNDDASFGEPSAGVDCRGEGVMSSSYRGLFGDAWLTCALEVTDTTADPIALQDRAGRWCVAVAMAASG